MPRKPKSEADKQLELQVAALIKNIKQSDEPKIDVARALALFERAAKYQEQALTILRGEEVEQEPAPGKNRVGHPRKVEEEELEIIPGSPPNDFVGDDSAPTSAKRGGRKKTGSS